MGTLDHWCYRESPSTVFQAIYSYLRGLVLGADTIVGLSALPLVPVGSRLVRPSSLFQTVQQVFAPFIQEVSVCLLWVVVSKVGSTPGPVGGLV